MVRLLHVGLGPLGIKIVQDLVDRRLGTLVGVVDTDPALAGKRVRDVVPGCAFDTPILPSLEALQGRCDFDAAVVTTSSDLRRCADTFRALLAMGKPVVSTCEELVWPRLRHAALADELDALARSTGGRLLGTGVNPGAMMDAVPVFASSVCKRVRSVEIHRIQDATTRRLPFQKKIGATLSPEGFAAGVAQGWLRHVGLGESLHFVAHYLGLGVDGWSETIEPVIADAPMSCGLGPIAPGCASGVRQVGIGTRRGEVVIKLIFQAAIGQHDPQDRVILSAEPPIDLVFRGGVHGDIATSAMTLNCVPSLIAAAPGLHTMASIPMPRCVPGA